MCVNFRSKRNFIGNVSLFSLFQEKNFRDGNRCNHYRHCSDRYNSRCICITQSITFHLFFILNLWIILTNDYFYFECTNWCTCLLSFLFYFILFCYSLYYLSFFACNEYFTHLSIYFYVVFCCLLICYVHWITQLYKSKKNSKELKEYLW